MSAQGTVPPTFERSEWEFWEGLRGTSRGLGRLLQQELRRARITPPQYWALHCLKVHGPVHGGKLSRWLDVTLPTVSGVVDHLERLGYVERNPSPEDRRRVMLVLTPKGARLVERLDREQAHLARELVDLLPPRDRAAVTRALHRLSERLTPEHGPCENCGRSNGSS
jgi:MarR family 2-MHQ and catechol resistance regulon transcriptional repressor